jgi:protein-S-isoprenylcysteine O-methyltransferase Ste14
MRIQSTAIAAGIIAFVGVYALGGMVIIFGLSLMPPQAAAEGLTLALRFGGYLALAFPAYVAARAARRDVFMHALLMGVIEGVAVVLLMTFTFSFEGSLHQHVLSRMLPVFVAVLALAMLAGLMAVWRSNRDQRRRLPDENAE